MNAYVKTNTSQKTRRTTAPGAARGPVGSAGGGETTMGCVPKATVPAEGAPVATKAGQMST